MTDALEALKGMRYVGLALILAVGGCGPPLEPSSPSFSHICCPAGVSIPFRSDGQWTAVSVASAGGASSFEFRIFMTHPVEKFLGPGGPAGSFPGGTLVQLVVEGCNPDFVNLCFTARTERLSGSESSGEIRFGAELSQDQVEFDDFLFDVFLVPVTPGDTLAVELIPVQREFLPVLAGCFDARNHSAGRCRYESGQLVGADPVPRDDTTSLRVRVFYSPSGLPAPGASVRIVASITDPIGAHQHFANRPTGTFFLLGDAELVDSSNAGVQGQLRLTMDGQADTVVIYRTTGVAGVERLFAQATVGGETRVSQDSVVVRVRDLVQLTAGSSIDLIGTDDFHPESARYSGTAAMLSALRELADSLKVMADSFASLPADQRPDGRFPGLLGVNDMSLPWGGLFDLGGTWRHPHKAHRTGRSADIDVRRDAADDNLALAVFGIWQRLGGRVVNERQALNHLHLEF